MMTPNILTALQVAACALAGVAAVTSPVDAEDAYRGYHNERFGVSADVPRDWRAGPHRKMATG
jgi:hypothetical protein